MRSLLFSLPVVAGTSLLLTGACTAMHTVEPADLRPPHPLTRVWVTRADHTLLVFDFAHLSGDSLIGTVHGWPQRLPLSEAAVLRVREPVPDRTAALVFVGVAGVAVYALHLLGEVPPPYSCSPRPCGFAPGLCC